MFIEKMGDKSACIAIVGLGYVGVPLALSFCKAGYRVIGIDISEEKVQSINAGESYFSHIPNTKIREALPKLTAMTDFSFIKNVDAIIVCVPTPITKSRDPDTSFIEGAVDKIIPYLHVGQVVSLESTTYPGTTRELVAKKIQEKCGLIPGTDYFLVFSPEREDPGNKAFSTETIPKVVGGVTERCLEAGKALYEVITKVVPVSSTDTAEMVKLFENIYRAVNIGLVNELKIICQKLGIDVWEVIRAAATKPFGFQAFWPGAGVGGHCIFPDPFYLSWKVRQLHMNARFVELAGEINLAMPHYVVDRVQDALNKQEKCLKNAKILILGIAYKPDIDDMRESPALDVMRILVEHGVKCDGPGGMLNWETEGGLWWFDPYINLNHVDLTQGVCVRNRLCLGGLDKYDCVVLLTNHSKYPDGRPFDYATILDKANLIIDTKGVFDRNDPKVVQA